MLLSKLTISREQIAAFCRRHNIRRLSLFASVLRDDFRPDNDVDVLVDFEPGHTPAWEIIGIEEELSRLVGGRRVDLISPKYLLRGLKDRVLASATLQYEAPHAEG